MQADPSTPRGRMAIRDAALEHALDEQITREAVDYALAELERRGVTGKGPRLSFCRLYFEYTDEASLAANTALIQHNAGWVQG